MFELIDTQTALSVEVSIEGERYLVAENMTVAAAALFCGLKSTRKTPVAGSDRLPLCMMGVCFDCLMVIDGVPNQRACQIMVQPGMTIERQDGEAQLEAHFETEV